jgi:ectoine hydroxylase-related dioxygenase (phytanoyl-CoA dioxygenase family)
MPELTHFPADAATEDILRAIQADGAVIIDALVDPETIARLRTETDPYMAATDNGLDDFSGRLTTRTGGLVTRSAACCDLVMHQRILELCDGFLLPNCQRYQLHLTQIIRLRPGQGRQVIHRDRWAWGSHLSHVEPQLNTIWALSHFSEENGATQVVPGSTQWPDDRVAEPGEITQATMAPGSVLVYTGSVFHGGGENRSEGDRAGLNITYSLGWLRQEENQYLSTPPELARQLPDDLQELIGYALGQYALGYYTPPGAPGEHPNLAPPQYALGHEIGADAFGDSEELNAAITGTGNDGVVDGLS